MKIANPADTQTQLAISPSKRAARLLTLRARGGLAPLAIFCATLLGALPAPGQTVTWNGGNSFAAWSNPNNWNPQVAPLNSSGSVFTVIVPDASSLRFEVPGGGAVDALSFGVGSRLMVTNGQSLTVNGVAVINGQIQATGAGSAFLAPANTVQLTSNPQFLAAEGATIAVGGSTYLWNRAVGSSTLLSAIGNDSLVDLHGVSSLQLIGNNNPTYTIFARTNGVVDLSGLANLSGPGGSGVLEMNVDTGGQLKLGNARLLNQNLRFNLGVPAFQLPKAASLDSVTVNQSASGQFEATNLLAILNSSLNSATGGVFSLPALTGMTNSAIRLTTNAVFSAPQLWSLDTVSLTLLGDGSFQAPNLVSYVNSAIQIQPDRDFESGILTNIYGSSIGVSNGATFRIAATAYQQPAAGYAVLAPATLFRASGAGSVLDLSTLDSIRVYGAQLVRETVNDNWRADWTYSVHAANGGKIDLSGLRIAYGADPNNYNGGDDWLSFKVDASSTLLLPNLKQVTQRTRFDLLRPLYALPSLQTVDNTLFSLQDGGRVDLASLTNFDRSSITFGFNSTFNAPQLRHFLNSDLNLVPGQVLIAPPFTNIYASRFSVSSGATLALGAPAYDCPADWRWSPTLFSANGAGSVLDLSTLQTLSTYGGSGGAWTYSINANNSGAVNLSGLLSAIGPDPQNYDGDDWLQFSVQNSGSINLSNLRQASGQVRFKLGDGTRLDLPNLTSLANGSAISFGAGSVFNAPALTELVNSDLSVATPGAFASLPLTNINGSRLSVSGGSVLRSAARSYEIPPWGYYTLPGGSARFAADGAGSLLDLSQLESIRIYGVNYGYDPSQSRWHSDWDFTATAANQGLIDLSALRVVYGADPDNYSGGDDWFSFNAKTGGTIRFGDLSVFQRARFSAADPNSTLDFGGLYLRPPATLALGPGTTLRLRGDFRFENTSTNTITGDLATLRMDGLRPQRLEVGGRDIGPSGTQGNFGFGQLVVGATNRQSIVRLVDTLVNGGRGAAGEAESLYLYGLGGQGLRLLSGSRLVLGNLNCYAQVDGLIVNLRSLIPAGTNSVAFGDGFIANYGGPRIISMTPGAAVTPAVSSVDITFNIPIQASSFTTADVQITGPAGPINPTSVAPVSGATWRISFPAQTLDGIYTVNVGPNLNELAGNFTGMDQNGDGLSGDGAADAFTGTFSIDATAPKIVQALTLQNGTRIGVTFDEPVDPAFATNPANYSVNGLAPVRATLKGAFAGGLLREVYANIGASGSLSALTSAAIYPDYPTYTNLLTDSFESPRDVGDGYGQRIHGYVIPPLSGMYTFWISSDDSSALYLSTDDNPTNQTLIASMSGYTSWRNWTAQPSQQSAPVFLEAGQRYYIRVLHKEATGGDFVSVRWLRPDAVDQGPIPATYFLPYGATPPLGATRVALEVPAQVGGSFTLTANNVSDPLGNTATRSFSGTILNLDDRDLGNPGNPAQPGATLTFNGDDFEMVAGGSDFYTGNFDAGHFANELRYGDFDVRVRVGGISAANACAQAGLMWRESTAANSRRVYVCVNPPGQCNGYSAYLRTTPGAYASEWPSYSRPGVPSFSLSYAWIRLQRQGDVFTAYRSSDGINWTPYAQVTASLPAVGLVGPASSARESGGLATITYLDFGDLAPALVAQPQSQTVAGGATVSFGVTVRGLPPLACQWYFNGLPLNNANASLLTLPNVSIADVGDYRCVITNLYGSATSMVASLVVDGVGSGGFEGDIMPEPYGDNAATISDWVKVGRLVAGLDAILNGSQFQRADCAPRLVGTNLALGDGRLTVADWTQAGRYSAGLDPLTEAGGPTAPNPAPMARPLSGGQGSVARNLIVGAANAWQGSQIDIPVSLDGAQGDENGVGLSLTFDPTRLAYVGTALGRDASGAGLILNALQAQRGRIGVMLAVPPGQSLPAGRLELARVRFAAIGTNGIAGIQIGSDPAVCEVVNAEASPLPMTQTTGLVQIVPRPSLAAIQWQPGGAELVLQGEPGQTCLLQTSTNLVEWTTLSTHVLGQEPLRVTDDSALDSPARFYRLAPPQ